MTQYTLHITVIIQTLANGQYLGELLGFPEYSTFSRNHQSVERNLRETAQALALAGKARDLYQRQELGEPEALTLALEIEPPRRSAAWREPVSVTLQAIRQVRADGVWVAYLPALQITAVATREEELKARLLKEMRFALSRSQKASSLEELAALQQVESVELRREELLLVLPSPKALAQQEEKDADESKSVLEEVATDLCRSEQHSARDLPAAYEVETLLDQLVDTLAGADARSALLVGPSGVGKTAAVYELVRRRAHLQLGNTPFWATGGARLIAGAMGFGMWQERCQKLVREVSKKRAILYLGNLVELVEVGKSHVSSMGIAGFLRPSIARGQLLAICECTPEQLTLLERQDPHLLSAFRQIVVAEPSQARVRTILERLAAEYPAPLHPAARDALQRLHRRFGTYSAFPGRAARFLRNLLHDRPRTQMVRERDVIAAFAAETGLPRFMLDDEVPLDLDDAHAWFTRRLIGQAAAVEMVVDVLAAVKTGVLRPRRPIASLMFIGPTGVGKTEMAKALAEYFFSDRTRLTRFDMSEYATPTAVARLIGGVTQEEGLLTAAVRQQPFSVILLDEVEKADGSLFDLMLQVFGEGRLTDAAGRLADFSNSIVIMTSNLGAESFGRDGFGLARHAEKDAAAHFVEEMRSFLRPELFNRIDRIIPFLPLDKAAISRITERELELIRQRDGIKLRGVGLQLAPGVVEHLMEAGCDPRYGARPLKRAIEQSLLAPLAEAVNAYAEETPLAAEVERNGRHLAVRVRALAEAAARDTAGRYLPDRLVTLRRRTQRLSRCAVVIALHNDVFQLRRQIARAEERKKNLPALAEWRARLRRLAPIAEELSALAGAVTGMEDELLASFYGELVAVQPDWAGPLTKAEVRLNVLMRTLYNLRFANPDHVVVGVFGEDRARLFELARAYHQLAGARGYTGEAVWFGHEARGVLRHRAEAAKLVVEGREGAIGLAMSVEGPGSLPLFEGETGSHYFTSGARKSACLVTIGTGPLAEFVPPEGAERAGGVRHTATRREYDLDARSANDPATERVERWSQLHATIALLMEARLGQAIERLLDE